MNIGNLGDYQIYSLDKETAHKYAAELALMANQIPLVEYTSEHIVAEEKTDRKFLGKWDHSLVVLDKEKPIALLIAYERKAEGTEQYPTDSIYISELAVHPDYQGKGIAKKLMESFFIRSKQRGFKYLSGPLRFAVQTNGADDNSHVRKLYESFGFKIIGTKKYDNRTDVVMTHGF